MEKDDNQNNLINNTEFENKNLNKSEKITLEDKSLPEKELEDTFNSLIIKLKENNIKYQLFEVRKIKINLLLN